MRHQSPLAITFSALLATTAIASPIGQPGPAPDYGFHWATIGDPGNRNVSADELAAWGPSSGIPNFYGGGVDYTYRISKYETTTAQWFEFVQTAWPQVVGDWKEENRLTGGTIVRAAGQWLLADPMTPATPHWTWVARYCNWLHNGKGTDPSSWASGVYDTSTFYFDENGVPQHDLTRAPGAKYFLPTSHEWKKAGHWDPNKNDGEGGYWLYPHGSDEPPVSGHPDEGGETNAGWPGAVGNPSMNVIGLYDVTSPWGLYDMSGGMRETLQDTDINGGDPTRPLTAGSQRGGGPFTVELFDKFHGLWIGLYADQHVGAHGFRLAAAVPGIGTTSVFIAPLLVMVRRRRANKTAGWHRLLPRATEIASISVSSGHANPSIPTPSHPSGSLSLTTDA